MARRWTRLVVALATASLCALGGTAHGATTLTGLSDQGNNQYWPTGAQVYAESMGSKFQQARFITAWTTGQRPRSTDWNQMNDWYSYRLATGKTMLVSFNYWEGCAEALGPRPWDPRAVCAPIFPRVSDYAAAIATFRRQWPHVTEFTAWNEPNHSVYGDYWDGGVWHVDGWQMNPVDDPDRAADYYKALSDECRIDRGGGTCTAVAGDFSDGSGAMGSYPTTYKSRLTTLGVTPPAWAVHAYSAVNSGATSWIDTFFSRINPARTTWITEVGVKVCDAGLGFPSDAAQTTAAQNLVNLMSANNPARTYYYMLFGGAHPSTCPSGGAWDSGVLYQDPLAPQLSTQPRTAFNILYPELRYMYWALRSDYSSGPHQKGIVFPAHGIPVPGDWDGDGDDTPGMFDPSTATWYITNRDYSSHPEAVFGYGNPGDKPIVGDWDRDGRDTIGVFRDGTATWYLRNYTSSGPDNIQFVYGASGDQPFVGDWNRDGIDTPGVFRNASASWYLRNSNSNGAADISFVYGAPGDQPIVGDWNRDGVDSPGVVRDATATWYLRNANSSGAADGTFTYGSPGDRRAVGDWTATGNDHPIVVW